MKQVAALFVRQDSIYKTLPGVDAWDIERDARNYDGPYPVVAHPPCRAWGGFAFRTNAQPAEKNLARLAVSLVRAFGGVLEHPKSSRLWLDQGLPDTSEPDEYGGWTLPINQYSFGHRAEKSTLLYIVGCSPARLPTMPIRLGRPEYVIGDVGRASDGTKRMEISKAEREQTPPALAEWLVEVARRCAVRGNPITKPELEVA